ncbi:MAG: sulfatase, partial [Candidatus Erginobacter occultus]|nr:sulfatase [Candidatus Erginobacter occultus]
IGQKGVVFLNNFVPETETFAVLPLIMSSRYFSRPIFQMDTWGWGIRKETPGTVWQDFDDQQVLLPSVFSAAGYRTAIFHNHPWFVDQTVLVRSFEETYFFPTSVKKPFDEVMINTLLDWIREEQPRPFFIYYHVMSPHQPFPPQAEDSLFVKPGVEAALAVAREKFLAPGGGDAANWSEEELYYFRVMYDSNLAHSDRWIGHLYAGLEDLGLAADTIFIITSDHGELLGEHGRLAHGDFPPWEAIIHVPLIMAGPGRIPAGVRIGDLTGSIDIFPTLLDLAGLELPSGKELDGISLKKLFTSPESGRKTIYVKNAVRTEDYKYLIDRDLFFDLRSDPGERENISSSQPDTLKTRLGEEYDRFMKPYRERCEEAVRVNPLPEPFYFPMTAFTITPRTGYQPFASEKFPEHFLIEPPSGPAWHLNTSDRQGYLVWRPGSEAPPPLKLSCPLIDGVYLVSVLISPLPEIPFSPSGGEFRARFSDSESFRSPASVNRVPGDEDEEISYYLNYGPVEVREGSFSIELDYRPTSSDSAFLARHLKFSPPGGLPAQPAGEKELRERVNNLRSLGYVR